MEHLDIFLAKFSGVGGIDMKITERPLVHADLNAHTGTDRVLQLDLGGPLRISIPVRDDNGLAGPEELSDRRCCDPPTERIAERQGEVVTLIDTKVFCLRVDQCDGTGLTVVRAHDPVNNERKDTLVVRGGFEYADDLRNVVETRSVAGCMAFILRSWLMIPYPACNVQRMRVVVKTCFLLLIPVL